VIIWWSFLNFHLPVFEDRKLKEDMWGRKVLKGVLVRKAQSGCARVEIRLGCAGGGIRQDPALGRRRGHVHSLRSCGCKDRRREQEAEERGKRGGRIVKRHLGPPEALTNRYFGGGEGREAAGGAVAEQGAMRESRRDASPHVPASFGRG